MNNTNSKNNILLYVEEEIEKIRLDKYLSQNEIILENMPSVSRSYLQKLVKDGYDRLSLYSWSESAKKLCNIYQSISK